MAKFLTVTQLKRLLKKFNKYPFFSFLALVIFVLYLILNQSENNLKPDLISPTPTSSSKVNLHMVKVKRAIDGDTIELENGQVVRYIGVDTPELHDTRIPVECFAQEAYEFNKKLVEGKTVRLEKDVSETDKYKRLLRYVWVNNSKVKSQNSKVVDQNGEVMVNEMLVREGYAYASTFPPDVKYADLFRQAQQEAMKNNQGLWKSCSSSINRP